MSDLRLILDWDEPFYQGDSIDLPITVRDVDISNWKIRVHISDEFGRELKLASSNVTGGSATEVSISSAGLFTVHIPKDETDNFETPSTIEIEREDSSGKVRTIVKRKIDFIKENLDWTSK